MGEKPYCLKCGTGPLEVPESGRPPIYCGEVSRAAAAHEIRRINRRIQRLEDDEIKARMRLKTGDYRGWADEETQLKRQVKFLKKEIQA